jgi:hypothetical protein
LVIIKEPPAEALMDCPEPQEPVEKSPELSEFCPHPCAFTSTNSESISVMRERNFLNKFAEEQAIAFISERVKKFIQQPV